MMMWQPLNLTAVCPVHNELTACSAFGYLFLNLVVSLYSDSEDRRTQVKLNEIDADDCCNEEEYDFIVVGAGSAGCVVANRLTEVEDWQVLLLEAGPEEPDVALAPALSDTMKGSNVDWSYKTEPSSDACLAHRDGRCSWARGKMMGGSSSINTMVVVRGNRLDFDNWAEMGNSGWSYEEVLPYFKKFERNLNIEAEDRKYHGVHGPQPISRYPYIDLPSLLLTEAFNEIGLPIVDFDGASQVGTKQAQTFSEDGIRASTNKAYIQPIRYKRKNLTVKPNSEAVQILIDKNKRAYGVKYTRNGRLCVAKAKKDVIVSGGTINSPKLLLLSGIGPEKHLKDLEIPLVQNLPVGENLHDHVSFGGLVIALDNDTSTLVNHEEVLENLVEYKMMADKHGPISSTGPLNSVAFFKTDDSLPAPDIQVQTLNRLWKEYMRDPINYDKAMILPTVFYDSVMPRVQNIVPKSRGRLILNVTDPHGPPIIYANYLNDPADIEPIQRGVKFLINMEGTEPFKSGQFRFIKVPLQNCRHTIWGSDEYTECMLRHYTYTLSHQAGTCKMGPEWDDSAVVDPRLRVYGVSGLRVIDASIMPVVTRGNTHAPAMMIGEKGANMIKEDWLLKYLQVCEHCNSDQDME